MSDGIPSHGQINGLESSFLVSTPDLERSRSSLEIEKTEADVPAQELSGDEAERISPEDTQIIPSDSNSSFPPTDFPPDTFSSSASPIATNKAETEAKSSEVEGKTPFAILIPGDSPDTAYGINGAPIPASPVSEHTAAKIISEIYVHNDTEASDDIRFPEYFSSQNDEAQSNFEPQTVQSAYESLEWANETAEKAAKGSNKDQLHPWDETFKIPEDVPSPVSLHHGGIAIPLDSSPHSDAGLRIEGELREAELPNNAVDNQYYDTTLHETGPQNNYFSETEADNIQISGQLDEHKSAQSAPSLPIHGEVRSEEDSAPLPTSSAQEGSATQLNQMNGHRAASPTWFHGTEEDPSGDISASSQPWSPFSEPLPLDHNLAAQAPDLLNQPVHNLVQGGLEQVNQPDQTQVEDTAYAQTDTKNAATSTTVEKEGTSMTTQSQEEDLAAKWRAALGDDDFLEDETSFNPSNFFEDDKEGFLDDDPFQKSWATQLSSGDHTHVRGATQVSDEPKAGSRAHEQDIALPSSISQINSGPNQLSSYNLPIGSSPLIQPSLPKHPSGSAFTGFQSPQDQSSAFLSNAALSTRPQMSQPAQSFSDKSKGGYTSPYDLPMDITRPKKRPYLKQTQTTSEARASSNPPPPPPRSSSIYSTTTSPVVDSYPISHNKPDLHAAPNSFTPPPPLARPASAVVTSGPGKGSFFEELPFTKPHPANIRSNPVVGAAHSNPIPQAPFERGPPHQGSLPQRQVSSLPGTSPSTVPGYQLVPPEKLALFSHDQDEASNKVPAIHSRYSPAPASQKVPPPAQSRYASSSFVPRPHQPPHSMSFQPRRSSPLAQGNSVSQHHQRSSAGDIPRSSYQDGNLVEPPVPHDTNIHSSQGHGEEKQISQMRQAGIENSRVISSPYSAEPTPSDNRYAPVTRIPSKSPYAPQQTRNMDPPPSAPDPTNTFHPSNNQRSSYKPSEAPAMEPPRRSQTQSPGAARPKPGLPLNMQELVPRPASTNHQVPPVQSRYAFVGGIRQEPPRSGQISSPLNYIVPTDGREHDTLERWKGCPIFAFGFGGLTVTSFPKQIPRYSAGQATPMIKCSPGEVKVGKTLRLDESLASFPGPLKSKSKKKEVLDWLKKRIMHLENLHNPASSDSTPTSLQQRSDEQILLSKILQVIVEHDGVTEGNPVAITAIRLLLIPEAVIHDPNNPSEHRLNEGIGVPTHGGPIRSSGPPGPDTLELIRRFLLSGEREKAVWCAVDQGMWDHAMLISSTLRSDVWKQVIREFVRQEVRKSGSNTESLASLYQVFAGNWEESIEELVPASARAGFQMVRMSTGAVPPKNALEGLDRWRETLTLILNNRGQDDTNALMALGRLLSDYGRTEAAHICYLFGKTPGLFGGVDDPRVAIALLGADHHNYPFDFERDFNNILLTEVYEFATTVLAPSTVAASPHLQAYKLYHAMQLAEYGFKSEAQQYCDTITAALKSTTKLSPYYHSLFFGALEDLVERLRQAPKGASQSWISKPSMDKVSGSVWAKLNQFIAGDESDTNSAASGKGLDQDVSGPFARVSGDSPSLSRTPSSGELFSGHQAGGSITRSAPTNIPNSRFALSGQYAPRSSLEQSRSYSHEPRQQLEAESHKSFTSHAQYQPQQKTLTDIQQESPPNSYKPLRQPSTYSPQSQQYLPTPSSPPNQQYLPSPSSQTEYTAPPVENSLVLNNRESDSPLLYPEPAGAETALPPVSENSLNSNSYFPPLDSNQSSSMYGDSAINTYPPPSDTRESPPLGYSPPSYSYEPPSNTYDPPSYDPETTNDPESPQKIPKKKTYGDTDDEDDLVKSTAALRKEERARKDRETDEAFRKAAEADGTLSFAILS